MELQGKEAIKFFEKMPCDFQRYVQTVNPENLTVKYGVKGYKGSSVTGFQVLDGKNVVAKGAMGIDKTYGKKPILQMRVKLYQDTQNASINFKYDGSRAFNGSATSGSTCKDGNFHLTSRYGDTVNFEYTETNNFSNWLKQKGFARWDDVELPTAKHFTEYQGKFDKEIKEFVSGRRTFTPEQRENMLKEKMHRQHELVSRREYFKKRKNEIREQMQKEIEEVKANPKLKEVSEYKSQLQQYLKQATENLKTTKQKLKKNDTGIQETEKEIEQLQKKFDNFDKSEFGLHDKKLRKLEEEQMKLWDEGKTDEAMAKLGKCNKLSKEVTPEILYGNLKDELGWAKDHLVSSKTHRAKLLKEIETQTAEINDVKLSCPLSKVQEYEKALRSDIAKQIKDIRAKYKGELDKYSPRIQKRIAEERRLADIAEKEKALREQELEKFSKEISSKKISSKSLKEQLKKENIQPYQNQEVVNQIKNLKGSTLEVTEQSKNIFLKEMGFNPELVEARYATEAEIAFQNYGMAFEPISGKLLVSPKFKGSNLLASSAARHELDHFQLFANLCKSMGIENFKKMMSAKHPQINAETFFNTEFWNKAIQNAKVLSPAEVKRYTKAYKEYKLPGLFNNDLLTQVNYFGNPIEASAYDIQASIGKSLGLNSKYLAESTVMSRVSRRIVSAIEKFEQKTGKNIDNDYFEKMMETEFLKVQGNEIDIINVLNNVLKKLESM
ncbi:hypothetical protein J6E39_04365 [bacterium]|nr:hypothetical protein [bacterium]